MKRQGKTGVPMTAAHGQNAERQGGGFLEREQEVIRRIVETNGQPMFDGKDDALDFLARQYNAFPNYVNSVVSYTVTMPLIYERYEGEDLRDKVMSLDRSRHNAHESAIDAVNILNRLYAKMGMEPFADVDTKDRTAVADFAGRYVNEVFNRGIGGTMDELTLNSRKTYDTGKTAERLTAHAEMTEKESGGGLSL